MKTPPSSGPMTVVTPNTAPSAPWYLPRSRSGMTSPMGAVAVTVRPDSADPTMKITMLTWNTHLRPNRSPSLPASTVAIVSVRMYEVATQHTWPARPRSPTMVGRAVDTTV